MNRVLIIGGNGFVGGTSLHQQGVSRGYEVAIADMAEIPMVDEQRYFRCDIRDQQQLTRTFAAFRPNLVVNVAAIADIDYAEKERERAWQVNVEGAANGARAPVADRCEVYLVSLQMRFSADTICHMMKRRWSRLTFMV